MTNFQVYKKTLPFSFIRFLVDLLGLSIFIGCCVLGFVIGNNGDTSNALIGLGIGVLVGIIFSCLIGFFITNRIKAAQISMMTKGVNEGELPEHTVKAGFEEVKGAFGKITVFFVISNAIKGIFRQLGRAFNRVGTAIGGDVGNGITSAIDSAIQTVIGYLCDCCLGWIMFRKDVNPFKAGCEGAVIFFKHGKTLIKNVGRIFGFGLLSLIVIGGAFFGVGYLVLNAFPQVGTAIVNEIAEIYASSGDPVPEFFQNPTYVVLFIAAIFGIIMFSILHGVLVRPFILVGVLRNYMAAGIKDMPTEQDFGELAAKSPKFRQLQNRI